MGILKSEMYYLRKFTSRDDLIANTAATEPLARQNRAALPLKQSHVHGRRATLHGAVLHSITTPPGVFHRLSGAKRRRSLW